MVKTLKDYAAEFGIAFDDSPNIKKITGDINDKISQHETLLQRIQEEVKRLENASTKTSAERMVLLYETSFPVIEAYVKEIIEISKQQISSTRNVYSELALAISEITINLTAPDNSNLIGRQTEILKAAIENAKPDISIPEPDLESVKREIRMIDREIKNIELPEQVKNWKFDIKRDEKGFMTEVDAKAL